MMVPAKGLGPSFAFLVSKESGRSKSVCSKIMMVFFLHKNSLFLAPFPFSESGFLEAWSMETGEHTHSSVDMTPLSSEQS